MDLNDPKELDDPEEYDDLKEISIGCMDFHNPKVHGDTSIFDGLLVDNHKVTFLIERLALSRLPYLRSTKTTLFLQGQPWHVGALLVCNFVTK